MSTTGRDLGLRRVSRVTGWLVAGAVALAGTFSVLVAQARPGHAKATSPGATPIAPSTPDAGGRFLQPPAGGPPSLGGGGGLVTSGAS